MPSQIVIDCSKKLIQKGWTIAFAESATAGRMSSEFALVPDSGKILIGGIVCYDACVKEDLLKVPHDLIERFTAESAEVTEALARNFCQFSGSDICVAITGLTTEGGSESAEKPVGTMFFHLITPTNELAHRTVFTGSAEEIILKAVDEVAELLIRELSS